MMSNQVICLSDSDDEFNKVEERSSYQEKRSNVDCFPPVGFHYNYSHSNKSNSKGNKDSDLEDDSVAVKKSKHPLSVKNPSSSVENELDRSSDDSEKMFDTREELRKRANAPKRKQASKSKNSNQASEKARAKEQAAIEKNMKIIELKKRKNIQAGECLKFMNVSLDEDLKRDQYYSAIVDVLQEHNISHKLKSLPIPNSIMWKRTVENYYINDKNEIGMETVRGDDKQLIVIWNADDVVKMITEKIFVSTIAETALLIPDKRLTLVICGMDKYFESCKKSSRDQSQKNHSRDGKTLKVSRQELEKNLAEIQLIHGCSSCLVESPQDVAMLVYRFTKAIAEVPLKLERRKKYEDKIDWYAMGDNKDTVKVDKDGIGLKRLWQQQLCQFTLASLETAEAICSLYPSPQELIKAYSCCSAAEGEKLLKDIPIRRAAGPLSTARKIGPELSKKIFIMFTSINGDDTLGNDRE